MPRLNPARQRELGSRPLHLGKVLLFCEGHTEKNYFEYLAGVLSKTQSKYTTIEIRCENAQGNAQGVLNYANVFLEKDEQAAKYAAYEKHLVFDCDAPDGIVGVIREARSSPHQYELAVTNLVFEVWLIMHHEIVEQPLPKREAFSRMATLLGVQDYHSKEKAQLGTIRLIVQSTQHILNAIANAERLEWQALNNNYDVVSNLAEMNPYTTVHHLTRRIVAEIG